MKATLTNVFAILALSASAGAEEIVSYVNYIRQYQMPAGTSWDASDIVPASGTKLSALALNPGGARFDMWTMRSSSVTGLTEHFLDTATWEPTCRWRAS